MSQRESDEQPKRATVSDNNGLGSCLNLCKFGRPLVLALIISTFVHGVGGIIDPECDLYVSDTWAGAVVTGLSLLASSFLLIGWVFCRSHILSLGLLISAGVWTAHAVTDFVLGGTIYNESAFFAVAWAIGAGWSYLLGLTTTPDLLVEIRKDE